MVAAVGSMGATKEFFRENCDNQFGIGWWGLVRASEGYRFFATNLHSYCSFGEKFIFRGG